jgi:hypothetical protein
MNNMSTASYTLNQSDDTMFRRKTQKESVQHHVVMVSGVEKEYATRKVPKMDSKGSGAGQVIVTRKGQQVEGNLSLDEREMIFSSIKTSRIKRVANCEPTIEWDF